MTDLAKLAAGLTDTRQTFDDLTLHWDLFCDADEMPCDQDEFLSRMESRGYAELVPVDDDALEDPFAWERGIEPGGSMYRLTETGQALRRHLLDQEKKG